jgi:hypothetical protein
VHFGGVSVERSFEEILGANICGMSSTSMKRRAVMA